jgi:hypothetical protein
MPSAFTLDGRATAMVMLAEQYDFVIGGDPDRDTGAKPGDVVDEDVTA